MSGVASQTLQASVASCVSISDNVASATYATATIATSTGEDKVQLRW